MLMAAVARDDLPIEARRQALAKLADSPAAQARALVQLNSIPVLDPARTAAAITPLLLELPDSAVLGISSELDALLDSQTPGLRSAAVALKVRSGAPLGALAERDPQALLDAVAALSTDQAPATLGLDLLDLAQAGTINAALAMQQTLRLTSDKAALFAPLARLIDNAKDTGYDQWGEAHTLAMAALAAMHSVPDEQWPTGYSAYQIQRADPQTLALGSELYHEEEKGCIKCHGEFGQGTEGFPPLAGSPTLLGNPLRPATVVKYGLAGPLPHTTNPADGQPFNAQMEPLSYFNNAEMAAVITYARQSFGNFAAPVTTDMVTNAIKPKEEGAMWDIGALTKLYPFERDFVLGSLAGPQLAVAHWSAPPLGVVYMLLVVTALMLAILGATMLGGGPQHTAAHGASPA